MKASESSLEAFLEKAKWEPSLAILLSFIQVEHGLRELQSSWEGFTDSNDFRGVRFLNSESLFREFEEGLREFYLEEPLPV